MQLGEFDIVHYYYQSENEKLPSGDPPKGNP